MTCESLVHCVLFPWFRKIWFLFTFPIYLSVVIVLFRLRKHEDFKFSFFRLITSLGCMDLLNMSVKFIFYQAGQWGITPFVALYKWAGDVMSVIGPMVMYSCSTGQHVGVLLIAFNRFVAFMKPFHMEIIWNDKRTKWAIISMWLITGCFVPLHFTEIDAYYMYVNGTTAVPKERAEKKSMVLMALGLGWMCFTALAVLVLYGAIFVKACFNWKIYPDVAQPVALKTVLMGFSLSFSLVVFVTSVGLALNNITLLGLTPIDFYVIFHVFGDLYNGLNPYVLILFSKEFRKQYFKIVLFRNDQNQVVPIRH